MGAVHKFYIKRPRKGWRNDGGPIPHGFKSHVSRAPRSATVIIDNPLQKVKKGHWVVMVGSQPYGFSPAEMRRLYSRVPQ